MKKIIITILLTTSVCMAGDSDLTLAISFLIDRHDWHPKNGDADYAREMAEAIEAGAQRYNVDPYLLAAMANFESHFRPAIVSQKIKGKAGEIGILQCGPDCARKCPHFMDTAKGQALCGARWLRQSIDDCKGDEFSGLVMYASGHYCKAPKGTPFGWKARRRVMLRDRLKDRFGK